MLQRCHECSELGGDIWNLHFSPVACGLWAHSPEFGCQRSFAMNQPSAHPSGKMNSSLTSALPISALVPAWGCLLFPASCFSGKSYSQAFPQLLSGLWQGKARQEEEDDFPPFHGGFSLKQGCESWEHPTPAKTCQIKGQSQARPPKMKTRGESRRSREPRLDFHAVTPAGSTDWGTGREGGC